VPNLLVLGQTIRG